MQDNCSETDELQRDKTASQYTNDSFSYVYKDSNVPFLEKIDNLDNGDMISAARGENGRFVINPEAQALIQKMFTEFNCHIGEAYNSYFFDKMPLKFNKWTDQDFNNAKIRVSPGAIVRKTAFIGKHSVLMPCFINVGARIGERCMIDTWSTIGSFAQIGNNVHISGGVGIGGVLEPVGAEPAVVGNNCFIGARSEISAGIEIEDGCIIGTGLFLSPSVKIIDRETGEIFFGKVPKKSVVVPGSILSKKNISIACAVIVKKVDSSSLSKTALNDILRTL